MSRIPAHTRTLQIRPGRSRGFSLVEIMVGMIIGLLGIIVMLNVFSITESQKRTTGGGSEVQNTGAISLFGLQHDIEQAGWGISSPNLIGCNVTLTSGRTTTFAPVIINPASSVVAPGDAHTDTLLITSANTTGETEGEPVVNNTSAGVGAIKDFQVKTPTAYEIVTIAGVSVGDQVVVEPKANPSAPFTAPTPCNLKVDSVNAIAQLSKIVTVASGVLATDFPNPAAPAGTLFKLGNATRGPTLEVRAYAVRGGNLTMCDYTANNCADPALTNVATVWLPIANDIPILRALYGRDTSPSGHMRGIVDTYDQTTPTSACGWERTSAVRLVLVGRNNQPLPAGDASSVNATPPVWSGNAIAPIDLTGTNSALPAGMTWRNYRYKVFETTIPIRNILSYGVITGC